MAQYVDISLDKPRRVKFTINAVRELERHFGHSFGQILGGGNMGFEEITQMLTVGLKYGESEKRSLTDTKVGELIQKKWLDNDKELGDLIEILMEAMQVAGIIAKKEEEEDEDDDAPSDQSMGGKKELPNV